MKKVTILFMALVLIIGSSFNSSASVRYVKGYTSYHIGPFLSDYTATLYLTASEADGLADVLRPGFIQNVAGYLGGLFNNMGRFVATNYFAYSGNLSMVADAIDDAADTLMYGELLKVELSYYVIGGETQPLV